MDPFYVYRRWKLFYDFNLGSIHLNPSLGHKVPEHDAFSNHEMELFPVQYQILLLSPLQNIVHVLETMIESFPVNGEIVHEDLHNLFDHAGED
jgi:hypothetical protein